MAAIGTAAGTRIAAAITAFAGAAITAITMAAATIMEGSMAGMTTEGTWRRPPSWGHNGGHHGGHTAGVTADRTLQTSA